MHMKLVSTECHLASASGLAELLLFIHESAQPSDWARLHDPLGYLIGNLASDIARAEKSNHAAFPVAANANGRRA